MERKCFKCNEIKKIHSFAKSNTGEKGNVCYKCRYGFSSKAKAFENFEEKQLRYKMILEKHVIKKENDCWGWIGSKNKHGYGEIRINRKHHNASRASWIAYRGEIPKGMYVLHNCPNGDNRECCNPFHLWLGTAAENMHDMIKKNRQKFLKGDDCPWAKINSTIVLDVIEMLKNKIPSKEIAQKYDIKLSMVNDIKTGHRWGHIGDRTGIIIKPNKKVLKEEQVKEIKIKFQNGARIREISKEYGINETTIADIKHNRTWKHVKI